MKSALPNPKFFSSLLKMTPQKPFLAEISNINPIFHIRGWCKHKQVNNMCVTEFMKVSQSVNSEFPCDVKKLSCTWNSAQFSTCWCHSMLILVLNMDVLGAFLLTGRNQWSTSNYQVRAMHVEHQMKNMVHWKVEMQSWGHNGIGNVLPKIVKLPNIHRCLTRQKMRTDNFSLRRNGLAHLGIRRAPLASTRWD